MARGGTRPGAGRPRREGPRIGLYVQLADEAHRERLRLASERAGVDTVAQWVRDVLDAEADRLLEEN